MAEPSYYPIYAMGAKDLPQWKRSSHEWQAAVAVDKLPKYQLEVKMCCLKCEEKVIEEIREVPGVFDVHTERLKSKVVVVASSPSGLNEYEVLRKARKVNRKAKFVDLVDSEKPKKKDDDKEEEEKKRKENEEAEKKKKQKEKEEAEKKKKKEEEEKKDEEAIYPFKPYMQWSPSPYYSPFPVACMPGGCIIRARPTRLTTVPLPAVATRRSHTSTISRARFRGPDRSLRKTSYMRSEQCCTGHYLA